MQQTNQATGAKRGKTGNRCQARENRQPVPSAGKLANGAKREKSCNWCQAQENRQPVPSAGKQATGAKRGKTRMRQFTTGFALDWFKTAFFRQQKNTIDRFI